MSLMPTEEPKPLAIQKTTLAPASPSGSRGGWWKFLDALRAAIGLKPLELAERFAVARVRQQEMMTETQEVENEIKLLRAREEFELIKAEVERRRTQTASVAKIARAKVRMENARAKIVELAAKQLEASQSDPEEALQRVQDVIRQIELHGGRVEVEIPEPGGEPETGGEA
jgi:hypothetical protein